MNIISANWPVEKTEKKLKVCSFVFKIPEMDSVTTKLTRIRIYILEYFLFNWFHRLWREYALIVEILVTVVKKHSTTVRPESFEAIHSFHPSSNL